MYIYIYTYMYTYINVYLNIFMYDGGVVLPVYWCCVSSVSLCVSSLCVFVCGRKCVGVLVQCVCGERECLFLSHSLSLSHTHFLSLSLALSVSLSLCLSLFLSTCLSIALHESLGLSSYWFTCVCLSVCMSLCVCIRLCECE